MLVLGMTPSPIFTNTTFTRTGLNIIGKTNSNLGIILLELIHKFNCPYSFVGKRRIRYGFKNN